MCFQCVDTLFASKHAKGMSLRYDAILALSDNLISEDCFLCFCFLCLQCLSTELASPMPVASNFCVVGFVRWGYFWGDNNFWGWCYVIGLEFVCACARMVIFS